MTGLEDSIKGKTFYIDNNGEYKELGQLKEISFEEDTQNKYEEISTVNGFECEVNIDKETARKLRSMFKTDKERKAERRFNKNKFREFIKNK